MQYRLCWIDTLLVGDLGSVGWDLADMLAGGGGGIQGRGAGWDEWEQGWRGERCACNLT
jgi:hypothetical protein